jgi:peptide/nickel transport system substrate-binding protein
MHGAHRRGSLIVLLAIAVALVAVVSAPAGRDSTTTARAAGKGLVVARTADIDKLDPHLATAFQTVQTLDLIYGTLVQLTPSLDIVPGLATSWKFSNGARTLTLKLRKGVKFHDGSAFDSQDVKASLSRIVNQKTGAVARSNLADIWRIAAPNASTVVIRLHDPDVPLLASLADLNTAILSSPDIRSGGFQKKPNGTGPLKFASWKPGQSIDLVANPTYWGGKPQLTGVQFRVIPDETSVLSALKSGSVQMGLISDPLVARQAGSSLTVYRTPSLNYHVLQLNARHAPLTSLNVRLAIQCAVDRKEVLDSAALGEGRVVGPITSPAYRSNPNNRPCPTPNLTKAKQYLAAAGAGSGVTIHTIVETGEYATAVNEAQSLKAQLQKVGINLDLEILDANTYVKRWLAADFDAAVALNGGRVDPDTMYNRYFTSKGNLNTVAGFASSKLDSLFAQGRATTEVASRKTVYTKLSETLEDNAVWIWLFSSYDYRITTKSVHGFRPMPNGSLQYLRQTSLS